MKPLVIYHANCDDGFGAAFAAWLKFGDEAEYLPATYGDFTWPVVTGRDVYILDFSFPRAEMEHTFTHANKVIWLDHHKTAFEMWCPGFDIEYGWTDWTDNKHITLDNNKSGALLAWEYFWPRAPIPMLIQHIDDNDRWQFKISKTREFTAALRTYPHDFEAWKKLRSQTETFGYDDFIASGEAVLRAQSQMLDLTLKATKRPITITVSTERYEGLAANLSVKVLQSDAGHILATESGTFGLLWYQMDNGRVSCSLRSNGDYDVSAIAKWFGGGGHKNAAGFETSMAIFQSWLG